MCTLCGLPTTHTTTLTTLGSLTTVSFFTTFLGACWLLSAARATSWWKRQQKNKF